MTIADFRNWLRDSLSDQMAASAWRTGSMVTNAEKQIVIYPGKGYVNPYAMGGVSQSSYTGKAIRILLHWSMNTIDSELAAQEVYNFLHESPDATIGGQRVIHFNMYDPEPIGLGINKDGIYEYVITLEMIIER